MLDGSHYVFKETEQIQSVGQATKARANLWQPTPGITTFTYRLRVFFRNTSALKKMQPYRTRGYNLFLSVTFSAISPLQLTLSLLLSFQTMVIDPLVPKRSSPRAVQFMRGIYCNSYKVPTSVPRLRLTSKKGLTIRQLAWFFGPKFLHRRGKSYICQCVI